MNSPRLPRNGGSRIGITLVLVSLVFLGGCGGSSTPKASRATSTTTPTVPVTDGTATTAPPTSGNRSTVPTSTTMPPANAPVDRSLVPEATSSYDFEQSTINGVQYSNALVMSSGSSPVKLEINAGRTRHRFQGTLGIPDDQKSSSVQQVDISLDNAAPVFSTVLNFGEVKTIDIDVTNVLRIRITLVSKSGSGCCSSGTVAIGNPRFA